MGIPPVSSFLSEMFIITPVATCLAMSSKALDINICHKLCQLGWLVISEWLIFVVSDICAHRGMSVPLVIL